ncbi:MAG: vitamin K epoxide reductase family protein [Gammaproteobacteria bacterium]
MIVTGASGLLGSALVAVLAEDYHVVGMDLTTGAAGCEEIGIDLTDRGSIDTALDAFAERHGTHVAAVIHLAAYYDFTGEPHPLYQKLNVDGTAMLLDALQRFEVERFVYASTMLVHAPGQPGLPIDESTAIAPKWAYPQSKADAEAAIAAHHGAIPVTILRFAGAYSDAGGVPTLTDQIRRIYERDFKSYLFAGAADHGQSMVHIDDITDALRRTLDRRRDLPAQSAYLIGERQAMSYQALQNTISDCLHGERGVLVRVPRLVAKAGAWIEDKAEPVVPDAFDQGEKPFIRPFMIDLSSDHYELDIGAAQRDLGWEPRHRLRRSLPAICAVLERDPLRWYRANGLTPPKSLAQLDDATAGSVHELEQAHEQAYRRAHAQHRWAAFANFGLGAWLLAGPATLGYTKEALYRSDMVCGALLMVCALLSLSWRLGLWRWVAAVIGIYLMSAPLLFWAATPAAYLQGTLVGALVIGFAVAVRPPPGVAPLARLDGPTVPPGWSFSPSAWTQRLPIIALAVVGLLISRYLAAYQLEHIDGVWDPFFAGTASARNGTEEVITSSVSRAWPVPDAGLGALTYMLEILTGLIGSTRRWRTMPWLVLLFGIMIVPLGAISIFFIVIQPILIGTWCTLCLVAAAAMVIQIPYSLDELVATIGFLLRRRRAGRSLLRVFLVGDTDDATPAPRAGDVNDDDADEFARGPRAIVADCLGGGVNVPWNLAACIGIGVFLMFTRLALGSTPPLAHADHLIGALVVTVSVTALAEVARPVCYFNLLLGAALMGAPWLFGVGPGVPLFVDTLLGLALLGLCLPRGAIRYRYGALTRYLV